MKQNSHASIVLIYNAMQKTALMTKLYEQGLKYGTRHRYIVCIDGGMHVLCYVDMYMYYIPGLKLGWANPHI